MERRCPLGPLPWTIAHHCVILWGLCVRTLRCVRTTALRQWLYLCLKERHCSKDDSPSLPWEMGSSYLGRVCMWAVVDGVPALSFWNGSLNCDANPWGPSPLRWPPWHSHRQTHTDPYHPSYSEVVSASVRWPHGWPATISQSEQWLTSECGCEPYILMNVCGRRSNVWLWL